MAERNSAHPVKQFEVVRSLSVDRQPMEPADPIQTSRGYGRSGLSENQPLTNSRSTTEMSLVE